MKTQQSVAVTPTKAIGSAGAQGSKTGSTSYLSTTITRPLSPEEKLVALALFLLSIGTVAFYVLPGMISDEAVGSRLVNAFYCSAMTLTTVGFGDICPGNLTASSRIFIILYVSTGMAVFCGPVMTLSSSWRLHVPGGLPALASVTIAIGSLLFTVVEGLSHLDAIYASVIAGTTIGYGDITPSSDLGKCLLALYCVVAIPVFSVCLEPVVEAIMSLLDLDKKEKED